MRSARLQRGIAMMLIVYAVAALAVVGAISGGIYKIHHAGYEEGKSEVQAAWDEANAKQRKEEADKAAAAAAKVETGNAKAKVVYRTITQTVDKYIDRPIYRNVCFDADGLRDANAALLGALAASGKPDGTVPGLDLSPGRFRGGGAQKAD